MGLFANPVTLSDGSANHIFSFRNQIFDTKYVVGEYIEDAASVESGSILRVKHDMTKTTARHLVQRRVNLHPAANVEDTILSPVTINISVTCDKAFVLAEIQPQLNIATAMCAQTNFLRNLLNAMI